MRARHFWRGVGSSCPDFHLLAPRCWEEEGLCSQGRHSCLSWVMSLTRKRSQASSTERECGQRRAG